MNISKIDHIGIATKNLDEAMKVYQALGLRSAGIEKVEEQKVKVAFMPCGESELELLEPTEQSSPVAAFIEKKGEGIHHIALRVDDLEKALEELKQQGIRLIDEKPRYGAGGSRIAFLHPKATNGVLVELSERKEEE